MSQSSWDKRWQVYRPRRHRFSRKFYVAELFFLKAPAVVVVVILGGDGPFERLPPQNLKSDQVEVDRMPGHRRVIDFPDFGRRVGPEVGPLCERPQEEEVSPERVFAFEKREPTNSNDGRREGDGEAEHSRL